MNKTNGSRQILETKFITRLPGIKRRKLLIFSVVKYCPAILFISYSRVSGCFGVGINIVTVVQAESLYVEYILID